METKTFGNKKIIIRDAVKSDIKNAKKFQVFINSLIAEDAKLLMNKKATVKEEQEFLESVLKGVKSKTRVYILAEDESKIIGSASIQLDRYRRNHLGKFGITIIDGYRGLGLGKYLMSEVIRRAKKELIPKPKIIQLEVYVNNKPAISLYKKMGFKIVAKLPRQIHKTDSVERKNDCRIHNDEGLIILIACPRTGSCTPQGVRQIWRSKVGD